MSFSKSLLKTEMREIGQQLHNKDCDPFLNTGMKFAILKSLGTIPVEREAVVWI